MSTTEQGFRPVRQGAWQAPIAIGVFAALGAAMWAAWNTWSLQAQMSHVDEKVARLAGQVTLAEPPKELSRAVEQALAIWLPSARPATIPSASDDLRDTIDGLQSSMLSGVRTAYSGQLERLGWWADVIDLLATRDGGGAIIAARLAEAQDLAMGAPSLVPDWAFDELERYRLASTIRVAQQELAAGPDGQMPSPETVESVRQLIDVVRRSPLAGNFDAELQSLRDSVDSVNKVAQERDIAAAIELLQELRDKVAKTQDLSLRVQMLAGLDAQAMALLAPSLGTPQQAIVESKAMPWRKETEMLARQLDDQSRRTYQCWALRQIDKFEKDVAPHYSGFNDYKAIRVTMESLLLPINESLLDPPISQHFTTVWKTHFDALNATQKKSLFKAMGTTRKFALGEVICP